MSLTSIIRFVRALDTSSTTGGGKTGLTYSDITASCIKPGGTLTSLTTETITTLGTYQAPTSSAHIRIKEVSSSDPAKGIYEIHIHDSTISSGSHLVLMFSATGAAFVPLEIDLANVTGRIPTALTSNGNIKSSLLEIIANSLTETSAGYLAAAFKKLFDVATPVLTSASVNQGADNNVALSHATYGLAALNTELDVLLTRIIGTLADGVHNPQSGDTYGRIGANGSGLTSLAPASTALSSATWTGTRAAYLDKLNISGNVAASSEVTAIQNNTTTSLIAPTNIIRPTSGTLTAKIVVYLTDEIGNMEAPDSAPTLSVFNAAGTDLSARLASTSGTLTATGVYTWVYTSSSTDDAEEILFTVTVIEGGETRYKGATSWITDNASTDFTSSDRSKLNAVYAKLPTNNIADQTLLNTAIGDVASQTDQLTFGTYGVLADMRGIANHATAVDTGTDGVVSFISGAYVMTSGSTVSANIVQVDGENVDHDGNGRLNVAVLSGGEGYFDELRAALTTWLDRIDEPISDPKTLTSDYNAAKTAASQTSLDSLQESVDGLGSGIADDVISGLNTSGVTVTDIGSSALQQLGELGTIRVEQPMVTESTITLRQGDDYLEADSRQLQFLNTQGTWPNLTDAVCVLELVINSEKYTLDPGTVVVAVGVNQRVDIEVPRSITSQLNYSLGRFELTATLSTGSMVTLRVGVLNTILNN